MRHYRAYAVCWAPFGIEELRVGPRGAMELVFFDETGGDS